MTKTIDPSLSDYDILVPIFNAHDDVRRCVESLLRHTEPRHAIYLLDDASPDKKIAPLLRDFAANHAHIKVVTAEKNGGFIANVNRGFGLSRRDVIILNSDTEVTSGWLDRMDRCRHSDSKIGIVSPLSNNATILSIPVLRARKTWMPGQPDDIAVLVEAHSERIYPKIPAAIGFCMLITRETLDAVGFFDPEFGLGYGEENDLCLRAWAAGKHSVCCDDAYVQHYGEASFGHVENIGERRRRNAELLDRRWPGYAAAVYRYCQANPLRKLFEQLRLSQAVRPDRRPHILQVIHNYNAPGGTELHTQDIVERTSKQFRQTIVFPGAMTAWSDFCEAPAKTGTRAVVLNRINTAPTHRILDQPGDICNEAVEENFRQFIAGGDYDIVHFQHLVGWASLRLPRIAKELGKRCVLSVHDYFLLCPQYVLLNAAGERCHKARASASDEECLRCLAAQRTAVRSGMPAVGEYLRDRESLSREVIEMMDAVVVPSQFVCQRLLGAFGERIADKIRVIPHGVNMLARMGQRKPARKMRVGILGSLGPQKGLRQVIEAARLLKDAPIQLEVFGNVAPVPEWSSLPVKLHGGYRRQQLPHLLREMDLILIPSIFDETFCLTLSEAQALGIPALASAVGAIPERVADGETGFLFSPTTGKALADKLLELSAAPERIRKVEAQIRKLKVKTLDQNAEDYAELYRHILHAPAPRAAGAPSPSAAAAPCAIWQEDLTRKPDHPGLTSILILTWNQLEHTKRCVQSIAGHTPEPHEIICVDNGSTDGTVAWLREYAGARQHVRLIENSSNRGFAAGNNQGLSIARGHFVILLNNDTIVTPGWLGRFLRAANARADIGIFGPMSNNVSGPQLARWASYHSLESLAAFATPWALENADQIQPAERVVGFCLLMRRAVLEKIGGLDERYGSGNFEDDDLCIRARLGGFGIAIAKSVFVHHAGSQTFKGAKMDYRACMSRNWELFKTKWGLPKLLTLDKGYPSPSSLPPGVPLRIPLPNLRDSHACLLDGLHWLDQTSQPAPNPAPDKTPGKNAALQLPPCALAGHLAAGRELLRKRQFRPAWAAGCAALQARPFHPEAHLLLAEIALAAEAGDAARQLAQRARQLAPDWNPAKKFLKGRLRGLMKPDWLVLPSAAAAAPRLSVCLIVKNEEQFLGPCLASVRPIAAQIVVVDTGSTDHTVDIAKEHGAEVHHFEWRDDFSAARNEALRYATGDWVLSLDADEELMAEHRETILEEMRADGVMGYRLPIINKGREQEGRSYVPRLFRNAPGLFYVGRVHEQVFSSIEVRCRQWGLQQKLGGSVLFHHGYVKEVMEGRDKIARNLRLLERAIGELPGEPNLVMNLGLELIRSGQFDAGLEKYREAFQLMAEQPPDQVVPELRETLLTQLTTHLLAAKEFAEVAELWEKPFAKSGGMTASNHFGLGLAYMELNRPADAAEQMRQCLAKRGQPAMSPVNVDILKAAPNHCLALCLCALGRTAAAAEAFAAALADEPSSLRAGIDFARFQAGQGRPLEALKLLNSLAAEHPGEPSVWKLGGEISLSRPEFLEFARDWTGEAAKQLPEHRGLMSQRAEALLLTGDTEGALPLWRRAESPHPGRQAAAVVLCELLTDGCRRHFPAAEETAVSRELVKWYRQLIAAGAHSTVRQLDGRMEEARAVAPGFVGVWEAATQKARGAMIAA